MEEKIQKALEPSSYGKPGANLDIKQGEGFVDIGGVKLDVQKWDLMR
jgi:hypothetical protein